MMFGPRVNYCITYMTNQNGFDIYRRKFNHAFKAPIIYKNYDRCRSSELYTHDSFLISKGNEIHIYNAQNYKLKQSIQIEVKESKSREPF